MRDLVRQAVRPAASASSVNAPAFPGFPVGWAGYSVSSGRRATKFDRRHPRPQPNRRVGRLARCGAASVSATAEVGRPAKPQQKEVVARGEAEILRVANAIKRERNTVEMVCLQGPSHYGEHDRGAASLEAAQPLVKLNASPQASCDPGLSQVQVVPNIPEPELERPANAC